MIGLGSSHVFADGQRLVRLRAFLFGSPLRRRVARRTSPARLGVAGIALLGFGCLFALVRAKRSEQFDLVVTTTIQRRTNPWFAGLMNAVSWPGFPPQSRIIPPMLALMLWRLGLPLAAIFQFLGWQASFLATLVKLRMNRPRPAHPTINVVVARIGGTSFPSGHVLGYVGVYGFLAYVVHTLVRPAWLRRAGVGFLTSLIALVGPSRVYLGHHWTTDIMASYCLGAGYLIGLIEFYRVARSRFDRD